MEENKEERFVRLKKKMILLGKPHLKNINKDGRMVQCTKRKHINKKDKFSSAHLFLICCDPTSPLTFCFSAAILRPPTRNFLRVHGTSLVPLLWCLPFFHLVLQLSVGLAPLLTISAIKAATIYFQHLFRPEWPDIMPQGRCSICVCQMNMCSYKRKEKRLGRLSFEQKQATVIGDIGRVVLKKVISSPRLRR